MLHLRDCAPIEQLPKEKFFNWPNRVICDPAMPGTDVMFDRRSIAVGYLIRTPICGSLLGGERESHWILLVTFNILNTTSRHTYTPRRCMESAPNIRDLVTASEHMWLIAL